MSTPFMFLGPMTIGIITLIKMTYSIMTFILSVVLQNVIMLSVSVPIVGFLGVWVKYAI
jgi:hypothetical protein